MCTQMEYNLISVSAGVPQGSLLGPVLYNIYTSDIPELPADACLAFYADDTAILVKGRNTKQITRKLQSYLKIFTTWLATWKIKANDTKTQVILFPYKNSTLPRTAL